MVKRAFTLAEVLITLGIIGIVSSLTLPALLSHYRQKEFSTRLKKFYSVMSQAIKLSERENGEAATWDYIQNTVDIENAEPTEVFIKKYILPYLNNVEIGQDRISGLESFQLVSLSFPDGSIAYLKSGNCLDIYYDLNGKKLPNDFGKDRYTFALCIGNNSLYTIHKNNPFIAWGTNSHDATIYNDYEAQKQVCETNKTLCARYLQMNNWEYPKDYPWKL